MPFFIRAGKCPYDDDRAIGDAKDSKVVNQPQGDEMGAYERLLSDAMVSDGTVFAGQEFVEVKGQI